MKLSILFAIAAATALILPGVSNAQNQRARQPDLSVIQLVRQLEDAGYGPFNSLSRDDGNWEVEVRKDGEFLELTVDPATGNVLSEHRDDAESTPASDALPLSTLLKKLSSAVAFEQLDDISFERRYWEVELFQDGQKRELHVHPMTAKVISNRIDD
jgi:uncharacterized membrane protein YkoI